MTPIAAVERWRVSHPDSQRFWEEIALPAPERSLVCVRPSCRERASHRHHIVPRGVAGDYICIDDKWVVVNVADLCWRCHDKLESPVGGYKHRLRFVGNNGWGWYRIAQADDADRTHIFWKDEKNESLWVFTGFLKGGGWIVGA